MGAREQGQLLLIAGILLTTTLLTIAYYAVNITNLAHEGARETGRSLEWEYTMIKGEFGRSIEAIAKRLWEGGEETLKSLAIVSAIVIADKEYQAIESAHGLSFSARRTSPITGSNAQSLWTVRVSLTLANDVEHIRETVTYTITLL